MRACHPFGGGRLFVVYGVFMTQTLDSAATDDQGYVSFEDALRQSMDAPPVSPSEEPARETPENVAPATEEPAREALKPDGALSETDSERLPRRAVPKLAAENEDLRLTAEELQQRVDEAVTARLAAEAEAERLRESQAERQRDFETFAGKPGEILELEAVAKNVGVRLGIDQYATITPDEQQQLARLQELRPRQEYQDLFTNRAWAGVAEQLKSDLGKAVQACPGVDTTAIESAETVDAIYVAFYDAGAARAKAAAQDEIDELKAKLTSLGSKANGAVRSPAPAGASSARPGGSGNGEMTWEQAVAASLGTPDE